MNTKIIFVGLAIAVLLFVPVAEASAKGGGSRGGGSRSSYSSRSSTTTRSSVPSKPSSTSRSTTSSSVKAGSTVKTSGGKSVKTSAKKPTNSKFSNQAGVTGVDGYTPRFSNGYSAPAGSVVYYPQRSFIDYLPWIYLFSQNSPANDSATVIQPDGKEVVAKPEPEGADGLAILNWFILIVLGLGSIALVIYLVHRVTSR